MTPAAEFLDILLRLRSRDPDDPALEDMTARLQALYHALRREAAATRRENRALREQLGRLLHDSAAKQDELNAALRQAQGDLAEALDVATSLSLDSHRAIYSAVVDERSGRR